VRTSIQVAGLAPGWMGYTPGTAVSHAMSELLPSPSGPQYVICRGAHVLLG
jgi:hypothetical protein